MLFVRGDGVILVRSASLPSFSSVASPPRLRLLRDHHQNACAMHAYVALSNRTELWSSLQEFEALPEAPRRGKEGELDLNLPHKKLTSLFLLSILQVAPPSR